MLSRVDLPQPLGPIRETTSPSRTAKLTPSTATRLFPDAAAKRMVTLRYSSRTTSDIAQTRPRKPRCARAFVLQNDTMAYSGSHQNRRHGRARDHAPRESRNVRTWHKN